MFKINFKYEMDRSILKCVYILYTPAAMKNVIDPIQLIVFVFPREDSVISVKNSYIEFEFNAKQRINDDFADGTDI